MTDNNFDDLVPKRNEVVHHQHKKEVFWQITFPMILGGLLLLTACGFTVWAAAGGQVISLWRDISLIWMLAPSLILSLIPFLLLAALAAGVFKLIGILPGAFYKIQNAIETVAIRAYQLSNKIASPIIRIASLREGFRSLRK